METNDNPKPKKKLELKKEVITILQKDEAAKIFGGNYNETTLPDPPPPHASHYDTCIGCAD
ncbi:MAG: hypothetical protein JWR09_1446 [Mucilaginibacter sp.]|nr:hypothetical protein [Mucilaginibacter sp.]